MKKIHYLFLLLAVTVFVAFIAQDDKLKQVLDNFNKFHTSHTQEKIYLHTDKPYYATGDQIWFKAYVVDAQTMRPSVLSKIMYVDLINQKNQVKKTLRLPLTAGFGWGNIELADSLKEGNYRLRAYTNWMRNFDESFFYNQTFKVGDIRSSQLITQTNYEFSNADGKELVVAKVNFKNVDGFPYANREVNYTVELDGRQTEKGKVNTDDQGNTVINITNNKPEVIKSGVLNVALTISEGTIVNKLIPIKSTSNQVDVQFFPEGGDMVTQVRSKVAFKAVGTDGLGKSISGYVQDSNGKKIANILTRHAGMGYFAIYPEANLTYEAVVTFTDGTEKKFPLPAVKPEGIVLSTVDKGQDSLLLRVQANDAYANSHLGKNFTVLVQSSGNVIYSAVAKLSKNGFATYLSKAQFPTGIIQLTLFNDQAQPLSERLIFHANTKDFLNIDIKPDKEIYAKRGKVNIAVTAKTNDNNPMVSSLSMSVIDEGKVPVKPEEEHTIMSELLLKSDLKGYVENPNYYFHEVDDKKKADLDVLFMTQGWRRFNWQNIINNAFPSLTFKPEKTLSISGTVSNNKKPVANGNVTVFSSTGGTFIIQAKTDETGKFLVDSLLFPDSTKFVVQARTIKDKKFVEIVMDEFGKHPVQKPFEKSELSANINASMSAYIKNSKSQYEELLKNGLITRSIMLDEVSVVEKREKLQNSSNLNGAGNADRVITAEELQNAPNLEFALQGKVAGMMIQNGEIYFMRNMGGPPAQIILDGIFVEPDFLNTIAPQDVESVEIMKPGAMTAIYGGRGGSGVIVINTKRGGGNYSSTNTYTPGLIAYQPLGFTTMKQFYVPAYDKAETKKDMADLRSTIYWNPTVITDTTGNAKVNYFNADGTGTYRVVVEGLDVYGRLGRKVIRYKVN
ncbi:TonB-dependent receptor plug domain-containing protein [Pedobacter glucosidilyticus]|uniref:TonB-dependent receptor plug domain-containing protein n=1 Tax=Pedobacter glucosidilyticus TaxID=1122941 RepID=UPI000414E2F8|nr:TonB-dependent receptor plug domain-containing protein [Pedobacter glucosidilyticus]